jgi:DNA polymerase-3 subunit gamma/tau
VSVLATIARQEGIEVAEASLTVIARAAAGSFRDAIGVLDQLATYSGGSISLQQTLDILGVVQHDLLFEAVDLVDDHDTQGALLFVDRLNQAGTDYSQFMKDLLSHLRDLYVVKHTVEAPPSMALTEEQLATLRSQASRVSTARTLTFIDLLGEGLRAIRQGSDPRLELELAFIKMTAFAADGTPRPEHQAAAAACAAATRGGDAPKAEPEASYAAPVRTPDASGPAPADPTGSASCPEPAPTPPPSAGAPVPPSSTPAPQGGHPDAARSGTPQPSGARGRSQAGSIPPDLEHLRRAWTVVIDAVHKRQAGLAAVLAEGRLESLEEDELVIKFPVGFGFQADQVTRGSNPQMITAVLRELTSRDLRVTTRLAAESAPAAAPEEDARILSKDELLRVLKQEFDARLIDDGPTR